jgi:hypothetical protein
MYGICYLSLHYFYLIVVGDLPCRRMGVFKLGSLGWWLVVAYSQWFIIGCSQTKYDEYCTPISKFINMNSIWVIKEDPCQHESFVLN